MKDKLEKLKKLADAMYYAAQQLTTDTSGLRKAMDKYHKFIINEYHKEDPVSEDLNKEIEIWQDYYAGKNDPIQRALIKRIARYFAEWQKEQMMAKAIDATIEEPEPLLWRVLGELEGLFVAENNLHDEDGVKVIIVKEDEE